MADFRLAVDQDHTAFEQKILDWSEQAGTGITVRFIQKNPPVAPTILDDSNPYWVAARDAFSKLNVSVQKVVFPGGTDSRYCREVV